MARQALLAFVLAGALAASAAEGPAISGAGATTVAPLVAAWGKAYAARVGGVPVEYQAQGSVAGVGAVKSGRALFALSEARVSIPDLQRADLVQFPVLVEGIVPVVNLQGVESGALRLTGPVLADLFAGRIRSWADAAVAALNPGLKLPSTPVTIVHRSEGSGSTFLFTAYLSEVSPSWKASVGTGSEVGWPTGVGVSGSDQMAERVRGTPGAIGYVDRGRVAKSQLSGIRLRNKAGAFVDATSEGVAEAARLASWSTAPAFAILIVDQPGATTWPISGALFAVLRREQDPAAGAELLRFFDYVLGEGTEASRKLGAVPLPEDVAQVVRNAWPRLVRTAGGAALWPPKDH
jgi:phosphate transport system substrate-binding protein